MFLHISFADGSNPKVYLNQTEKEVKKHLQEWNRDWELKFIKANAYGVFHEAAPRYKESNKLF